MPDLALNTNADAGQNIQQEAPFPNQILRRPWTGLKPVLLLFPSLYELSPSILYYFSRLLYNIFRNNKQWKTVLVNQWKNIRILLDNSCIFLPHFISSCWWVAWWPASDHLPVNILNCLLPKLGIRSQSIPVIISFSFMNVPDLTAYC